MARDTGWFVVTVGGSNDRLDDTVLIVILRLPLVFLPLGAHVNREERSSRGEAALLEEPNADDRQAAAVLVPALVETAVGSWAVDSCTVDGWLLQTVLVAEVADAEAPILVVDTSVDSWAVDSCTVNCWLLEMVLVAEDAVAQPLVDDVVAAAVTLFAAAASPLVELDDSLVFRGWTRQPDGGGCFTSFCTSQILLYG